MLEAVEAPRCGKNWLVAKTIFPSPDAASLEGGVGFLLMSHPDESEFRWEHARDIEEL